MIKTITAATTLPVSLSDAKNHLRVSGTTEDSYIHALIEAATDTVENYTGRALITQTLEEVFNDFPNSVGFELSRGNLQSVSSVKYYLNDTLNTWATTNYFIDDYSIFPKVCYEYDASIPGVDNRPNAVVIQYIAGYGDYLGSVPSAIRQAILLLVGNFYENRDDRIAVRNRNAAVLPTTVSYLLNPYRLWQF